MSNDELLEAYRSTRYVIRPHACTGGVERVLRVGARHPELDAALAAKGHREWAFLTAWNPGSRRQDDDANHRAQEQLESQLVAGGWTVASAIGEAENGGWAEESFFVPGLPAEEAERLGRACGQVAVLVGRAGGSAELRFCERTEPAL